MRRSFAGALALACLLAAPALAAERAADEKDLSDLQLLGKRIFEDYNLSEPRGMSCLSCHDPRHAFQGDNGSPIPGIALGARPGHFGKRKVPTLMYKAYSPPFGFYKDVDDGQEVLEAKGGQFWDGRANDFGGQATFPLTDPDEMNNPSLEAVAAKIAAGDYADLAKSTLGAKLFDDPKTAMDRLGTALAAYEQSERRKLGRRQTVFGNPRFFTPFPFQKRNEDMPLHVIDRRHGDVPCRAERAGEVDPRPEGRLEARTRRNGDFLNAGFLEAGEERNKGVGKLRFPDKLGMELFFKRRVRLAPAAPFHEETRLAEGFFCQRDKIFGMFPFRE